MQRRPNPIDHLKPGVIRAIIRRARWVNNTIYGACCQDLTHRYPEGEMIRLGKIRGQFQGTNIFETPFGLFQVEWLNPKEQSKDRPQNIRTFWDNTKVDPKEALENVVDFMLQNDPGEHLDG